MTTPSSQAEAPITENKQAPHDDAVTTEDNNKQTTEQQQTSITTPTKHDIVPPLFASSSLSPSSSRTQHQQQQQQQQQPQHVFPFHMHHQSLDMQYQLGPFTISNFQLNPLFSYFQSQSAAAHPPPHPSSHVTSEPTSTSHSQYVHTVQQQQQHHHNASSARNSLSFAPLVTPSSSSSSSSFNNGTSPSVVTASRHPEHVQQQQQLPVGLPLPEGQDNPAYASKFCEICRLDNGEDEMLLCDICDLGFHTFCLRPPVKGLPEGDWFCPTCTKKYAPPTTVNKKPVQSPTVKKQTGKGRPKRGRGEVVQPVSRDDSKYFTHTRQKLCRHCKKGGPGKALMCDLCEVLWHVDCLRFDGRPPMQHEMWFCRECSQSLKDETSDVKTSKRTRRVRNGEASDPSTDAGGKSRDNVTDNSAAIGDIVCVTSIAPAEANIVSSSTQTGREES